MKDDVISFTARQIAVDIFQLGDEPGSPTRRIQFMGGNSDNEIPQGGLSDKALTNYIEESLRKWLSAAIQSK